MFHLENHPLSSLVPTCEFGIQRFLVAIKALTSLEFLDAKVVFAALFRFENSFHCHDLHLY